MRQNRKKKRKKKPISAPHRNARRRARRCGACVRLYGGERVRARVKYKKEHEQQKKNEMGRWGTYCTVLRCIDSMLRTLCALLGRLELRLQRGDLCRLRYTKHATTRAHFLVRSSLGREITIGVVKKMHSFHHAHSSFERDPFE